MVLFDSEWLIGELENHSKNPRERMLYLFDVLESEAFANKTTVQNNDISSTNAHQTLINYLTTQAQMLGAANPSMLAEHIVLIARSAASQAANDPNNRQLAHAKKAAEALIFAQTQNEPVPTSRNKSTIYALAACVMVLLGISAFFLTKSTSPPLAQSADHQMNSTISSNAAKADSNMLTAQDAVAMYAQFDQMRTGTCQFPEAIQIPDKDKAVYIDSVVGGKLPTNLADLATANKYLAKVRCNYTPMLMQKSK